MKLDLGVRPAWTRVGIAMLLAGLVSVSWTYTHLDHTAALMLFVAPLMVGVGGGILLAQWRDTRKLRRAAREWADAHPGEDPDTFDQPVPPTRLEKLVRQQRSKIPPEDNPYWSTYTRRWVDNPENPTDGSGGMDDHD